MTVCNLKTVTSTGIPNSQRGCITRYQPVGKCSQCRNLNIRLLVTEDRPSKALTA